MKKIDSPAKIRYANALAELPAILKGYIDPVYEALRITGRDVTRDEIINVKKGHKMDWQILNAIRIYHGLETVQEIKPPTAEEIAERLKLELNP